MLTRLFSLGFDKALSNCAIIITFVLELNFNWLVSFGTLIGFITLTFSFFMLTLIITINFELFNSLRYWTVAFFVSTSRHIFSISFGLIFCLFCFQQTGEKLLITDHFFKLFRVNFVPM